MLFSGIQPYLVVVALAVSILAVLDVRAVRKELRDGTIFNTVKGIEQDLIALEDRHERLLHMHKNLRSSVAMRNKRALDSEIANESPEQWKQRKRAELALGRVKK